MELRETLLQIRQDGMEKAAVVWEILENLPTPIDAADIYKAASTTKCAEFVSRTRSHKLAPELTKLVLKFLDDSISIVGVDSGSVSEGARVLTVLAKAMPLTEEVFNDPAAYAVRQHVYDGLLLLAASRLGKEAETKKCIEDMQLGVSNLLIKRYLEENGIDPDKVQA